MRIGTQSFDMVCSSTLTGFSVHFKKGGENAELEGEEADISHFICMVCSGNLAANFKEGSKCCFLLKTQIKRFAVDIWSAAECQSVIKSCLFSLQVVFVPMWIVMSLLCLLVLYYVIWSIIFVRTAANLPSQRKGHIMIAIASVLLVIPLLTFQVTSIIMINN